jgi:uncharacterized protein YcaQ
MKIVLESARRMLLEKQGLTGKGFGKGKAGALAAIRHLGYLQIDTLAVVARAHHHTLWSRVKGYQEDLLDELLEGKEIFEYWSHAASFLPMEEYRFSLPRKQLFASGKSHWFAQDKKLKQYVYDRIRAEGPLLSRDFEYNKRKPGMWNWKPAKRALEQLFQEGKLMVARRQGFQKVYDLTERVLPGEVDTSMPAPGEYAAFLVQSAIRSGGLVTQKEICYLRRGQEAEVKRALARLLDEGKIEEAELEGAKEKYYLQAGEAREKVRLKGNAVQILSPFDNAVIQRKRLQAFFGFDFMIECYLPAPKRKFGYFCLPVLYGERFVARFDPKADREKGVLEVKNFHLERGFKPDEAFAEGFAGTLKRFAAFNQCREIRVNGMDKRTAGLVKAALKK